MITDSVLRSVRLAKASSGSDTSWLLLRSL